MTVLQSSGWILPRLFVYTFFFRINNKKPLKIAVKYEEYIEVEGENYVKPAGISGVKSSSASHNFVNAYVNLLPVILTERELQARERRPCHLTGTDVSLLNHIHM